MTMARSVTPIQAAPAAARTAAQRQADYRAARADAGLKEARNVWCHPDDEAAIRSLAERLAAKRERAAKKGARA
jgi:hypothetical protein